MARELRRVRALSARTEFVAGYGQVHFDPDSSNLDVRYPKIPEEAVPTLLRFGWVDEDLSGFLPQLDHDKSGAPGGSKPATPARLVGKNKEQLLAIAMAEGAAVNNGMKAREIMATIKANRDSQPVGEPAGEDVAAPADSIPLAGAPAGEADEAPVG